jgi:hypothetical protein
MVVDYTPSEHLLNGSAAEPADHRPQRVRTDG